VRNCSSSAYLRFKFILGNKIKLNNPNSILEFFNDPSSSTSKADSVLPYLVVRGVDNLEIEEGDTSDVDHVIFMVHGIGAFCDLRLRTVVPAVDEFRAESNHLLHTHFSGAVADGVVGRVEYLPVAWHSLVHQRYGLDTRMELITLQSVPLFRSFANDAILDVLYYCSPVYKQAVVSWVGDELNRQIRLFQQRNPTFSGRVSLVGHSLGTVILLDLLKNQPRPGTNEPTSAQCDCTAVDGLVTSG